MTAQIIPFRTGSRWIHHRYTPDQWHRAIDMEAGDARRAEQMLDMAATVAERVGLPTRADLPYMSRPGAPTLACWRNSSGALVRSSHQQRIDAEECERRALDQASIEEAVLRRFRSEG